MHSVFLRHPQIFVPGVAMPLAFEIVFNFYLLVAIGKATYNNKSFTALLSGLAQQYK